MTKFKSMSKYPLAPLKMTMHHEWDVLYTLYDELKWFPYRPILKFVPNHQDDDDEIFLYITTQLNVHADDLASKGLEQVASKFCVSLGPFSKVYLYHDGHTVTQDYKNFHLPPL